MGKITQWESQIDGRHYAFTHEQKKGKHVLTANGVPLAVKGGIMSALLGFDEEIIIDGKEARFVFEKNQPDIAVDHTFLRSGADYRKRPAWVLVFAILCLAIPIVSLGGAIPVLLGLAGVALCVVTSKSSLPAAIRVVLCTVITLAAWVLWFLLILGMSML